MSSMIDLIGSFVIGTMFIITIFNSLFNINAYSTNLQFLLNHTQMSEKAIDILDSHILANVGSNQLTRGNVFPNPAANLTSTSCTFWGEIDRYNSGNLQNTLITVELNSDDELIVYLDGVATNIYAGPFQLSPNGLSITYLNSSDGIFDPSFDDINDLYGAIFDVTFQMGGHEMDWGTYDTLIYRVRIWKYFKNLYL